MENFEEVIGAWPSVADLAADLDELPDTVFKWRARNSIPPRHWDGLVQAARRRKIPGINFAQLSRIAATPRSNTDSARRAASAAASGNGAGSAATGRARRASQG